MKRVIIVAALALLTAACGDGNIYGGERETRNFYRDNTSVADYQRDSFDCEALTSMAVPASRSKYVYDQMMGKDFYIRCMSSRGYVLR